LFENKSPPSWLITIPKEHENILISYDEEIHIFKDQINQLNKKLRNASSHFKNLMDQREKKDELKEKLTV
jgi:hypothetical protein